MAVALENDSRKTRFIFKGFQPGDGLHNFVGDLLINLLETRLGTKLGFGPELFEPERLAVFYGEPVRTRKANVPTIGAEGSEYAYRYDGSIGFDNC